MMETYNKCIKPWSLEAVQNIQHKFITLRKALALRKHNNSPWILYSSRNHQVMHPHQSASDPTDKKIKGMNERDLILHRSKALTFISTKLGSIMKQAYPSVGLPLKRKQNIRSHKCTIQQCRQGLFLELKSFN